MKYFNVKEFDKYGFVKTLMTAKDAGRFRIYSHNVEVNMEDMKFYNEIADEFNIKADDMVRVMQSHTSNVYVVKNEDRGMGVVKREPEYGIDGLITNEKNLMLMTVEADCTPVFILDKEKKAIGMIHSGWRGTVNNIAINAINLMKENYGSKEENIIIYLGPSICMNCYEVGMELIDEAKKVLDNDEIDIVFKKKNNDKYLFDVSKTIEFTLLKNGIKKENIYKSDVCTYHDNIYSSWRRDKDKTNHMLTGIMIIE